MSARPWDRSLDRLRTMSARDRRALMLGAIVLVPALLWTAVVRPYRAVLEDLQDRLTTERALLDREKSLLREGPTLPDRLGVARSALEQWDARFVRTANPALAEAEVTALLEGTARESRVLLQEVRTMTLPPEAVAPEGLVPFRLSVRGESDFEGVLRFLHGLEQDPLLLRIVGLSVEPVPPATGAGAGTQPGAMTFVVIVEAYVPADTPPSGT